MLNLVYIKFNRKPSSLLWRISSAHTWIPAGVSVSKNFLLVQLLNNLKGKWRFCFCIQTFFFLSSGAAGVERGAGGGEGGRGCSAICYLLSAMTQVWYLHPEFRIRIKAANIKMINLPSPSWVFHLVRLLLCSSSLPGSSPKCPFHADIPL